MGNDLADAIRALLSERVLDRYGDYKVAAKETGVPYKTLYRGLTENGKDRTARVSLDFVLEVATAVGVSLPELYEMAKAASGPRLRAVHNVRDIRPNVSGRDDYEELDAVAKTGVIEIDED